MKKVYFVVTLIFLSVTLSCGGKKVDDVDLRINLTKGEKYDMRMEMEITMEMDVRGQPLAVQMSTDVGLEYEVMDILPNGNFLVRHTVVYANGTQSMLGESSEYDSKTDRSTGANGGELRASCKAMVGETTYSEIDKQSNVIKTKTDDKEGPKADALIFLSFPDKKIKVGDSWKATMEHRVVGFATANNKSDLKLLSVKNGMAEISIDGKLETMPGSEATVNGTLKGIARVDLSTGLAKEVSVTQIASTMLDNQSKTPAKITNKIRLTIQ